MLNDHNTMSFNDSLLREGRAMRDALTSDFAAIADVELRTLVDHRLPLSPLASVSEVIVHDSTQLNALRLHESAWADWTVVIAPELDGALQHICAQVELTGGRLLGSSQDALRIAGDKHLTAEWLSRAGVCVPRGRQLAPSDPWPRDIDYPCVLKPCDGAGSQDVRLLASPPAAEVWPPRAGNWRVESYCPGRSASVAWLCGPRGHVPLLPMWQRLSDDGHFTYRGGALPLPQGLSSRAVHISRQAIESLPSPLGYVGVDLVLGDDPTGRDDVVIEINPRLTTSYVGLRAGTRDNLAQAMLYVASGHAGEWHRRLGRPDNSLSGSRPRHKALLDEASMPSGGCTKKTTRCSGHSRLDATALDLRHGVDLRFDATPLEFDADGTIRRLAWV